MSRFHSVYADLERKWDAWEKQYIASSPCPFKVRIELNGKVSTKIVQPLTAKERRALRKMLGLKP
jgi:hypothetical protein